MAYDVAINKAWGELAKLNPQKNLSVKFLADEYSVDLAAKKLISLACNVPAKDFSSILILHYLIQKLKGLPGLTGEWLSFRELSGVEGYAEAFRKRSLEPIIRKYGKNPEGILSNLKRFSAKQMDYADASVMVEAFEKVPVLIKLWRADEEFGPDANMFFDRSITGIFCTEDIAVLAGMVATSV